MPKGRQGGGQTGKPLGGFKFRGPNDPNNSHYARKFTVLLEQTDQGVKSWSSKQYTCNTPTANPNQLEEAPMTGLLASKVTLIRVAKGHHQTSHVKDLPSGSPELIAEQSTMISGWGDNKEAFCDFDDNNHAYNITPI